MHALILEDEASIREVEAVYLKKAGFVVAEVADGLEALRRSAEQRFDLFVIDVNVPGLSGLEVYKRLRQQTLAPIMMVTARSQDVDELIGLECGADDYIKKPFNPDVLVARANALLRRHGERELVLGPLTIDPQSRSVRKGDRAINLSSTQFNILYFLASHPGRVYSRSEIVDYAWGDPFDCDVLERTVDAHIKRLRKALEEGPAEPQLIQTVIGAGYKVNPAYA